MVESYQVSPDRLVYSFTLRPGLKFHDGQPVTTRDVIPSIKRWMVRNTLGQTFAKFIRGDRAHGRQDFRHPPQGASVLSRWRSARTNAVIMREKDAATDPFRAITETVGSARSALSALNGTPGEGRLREETPTMCRAPNPPTGWPAAKS